MSGFISDDTRGTRHALVYAGAVDLGRAIRRIRREQRPSLSIRELARASGMHPTYLSGIERGLRNPTWAKLNRLAQGLDVPLMQVVHAAEQERRIAQARLRIEGEQL